MATHVSEATAARVTEVGQRLASSTMPDILKREILDALPSMGERELGMLAYALRHEAAQLGLLERVLEDFESAQHARAPERAAAEDAVIDAAIAKYIDDVGQEAAKRTISAS